MNEEVLFEAQQYLKTAENLLYFQVSFAMNSVPFNLDCVFELNQYRIIVDNAKITVANCEL